MEQLTRLLLEPQQGDQHKTWHARSAPGSSMARRCVALALVAVAAMVGCGAAEVVPDLPPAALEGRRVVQSKGCAACHGSDGGGGVGPAFVGLFGTDVALQSGATVIADREYLTQAILEPSAELVEGYNLPMPRTELSAEEVDAVIAYIEALAEVAP